MSERITTQAFFDPKTWTVTYVVWDRSTRRAPVIDPVLDYDLKSGHTGTVSADQVLACVANNALQVDWILETYAYGFCCNSAKRSHEPIRDPLCGSIHPGCCVIFGTNLPTAAVVRRKRRPPPWTSLRAPHTQES